MIASAWSRTARGTAKGMTLTVATISRRVDDGEGRDGGKRQALMQAVQRPHPLGIDDGEAARRGMQIGAAGEWRLRHRAFRADDLGDGGGGLILRHIVRRQPGREDRRDAGRRQHADVVGATARGPS